MFEWGGCFKQNGSKVRALIISVNIVATSLTISSTSFIAINTVTASLVLMTA